MLTCKQSFPQKQKLTFSTRLQNTSSELTDHLISIRVLLISCLASISMEQWGTMDTV